MENKDDRPTTEQVVDVLGPFGRDDVLIGVASDGEAMTINTRMSPPNILIWNGETAFLKAVAEFIMNYKGKEEMEFIVFTNNHEEWEFLAKQANSKKDMPCIGVIPFWDDLADQILLELAGNMSKGIRPNHSVIVLIEGVQNVLKMDLSARQNFHHIFVHGKDRRVCAVGTVPEGSDIRGLQTLFYQARFNAQSGMYEFPEGESDIQVWIPKIEEK